MEIKEKVSAIICAKCGVNEIKESDDLTQLGLDSLDVVESMLAVEDEFHIEFENNELASLKTFKDVLELIEKKLKK